MELGVSLILEFDDDQGNIADVLIRRPENRKREGQTKGTVKKSIQGQPYRLGGVIYIINSFSSNPCSTYAALSAASLPACTMRL